MTLILFNLLLPEQGYAVVKRADQNVRITVAIYVHPSVDGVAEGLEFAIMHRLTLNHLQRAAVTHGFPTQRSR